MAYRRLRHGCLAFALLASSGLPPAACSSNDSDPLFANAWTLTSAVDDGVRVDVSTGREVDWRFVERGGCGDRYTFCPDGSKLLGNDACNDFARSIRVDGNRVVWGDDRWMTAGSCSNDVTKTLQAFFESDSFSYVIEDDQLHLASADGTVELALRASDAN